MVDGLIRSLTPYSNIPIYLVTDRTDCFPLKRFRDDNVHIIQIPETHGKMDSQSNKSKIFKLLPDDVVNVLYLDSDIRATDVFNDYVQTLKDDDECDLLLSRERAGVETYWNAGVFGVNRYASKDCLAT
eukprot:UN25809